MTPPPPPSDELREHDVCARCGTDVAWEVTTCPGCGGSFDDAALVTVFATANSQLMPILVSALQASDIAHVVQGGAALDLFPLGPLATGLTRNLVAATIHVSRRDAPAAVELLAGMPAADEDEGHQEEDDDEGTQP